MPLKVSFRIFPADSRVENLWLEKSLKRGAVSAPDDVLLRGDGADRFQLGTALPDEYHLAAAPWPGLLELGVERASCRIERRSFPSQSRSPGRRRRRDRVRAARGDRAGDRVQGAGTRSAPRRRARHIASTREAKGRRGVSAGRRRDRERAFLRRLPEGKFKTAVTVEHPYLIPPSISAPERELNSLGDIWPRSI